MASMSVSEEDLSCPVCCDIFKDPVVLNCSHSICKGCLETFWESKGSRECPVCRTRSSSTDPPLNLLLKNLCESFLQGRRQTFYMGEVRKPVCSLHHSELKLFCETDKQVICLVCRDSKRHKNHDFSPITETAAEFKGELKRKLRPLHQTLAKMKEAKTTYDGAAQRIRVQAEDLDKQINEDFEKLHQFLRDQEAARKALLWEEEKEKSHMVKVKVEKMNQEISSLSDTIEAIEEGMGADDVTFLHNYKTAVKRARYSWETPERVSETFNLEKYLGLKLLEKMGKIFKYTPVKLDPNTAHPYLIVSEDRTTVTYRREYQQLPDNPERFDDWINVVGSDGFNSGIHYWDVEVGNNRDWDLGVVTESAKRKGDIEKWPGVWCLFYGHGKYSILSSPQPQTSLGVSQKPKRVRVKLDWDNGKLSFSDPDNKTHIHTFRHKFTEKVYPFFGTLCTLVPLRILPQI